MAELINVGTDDKPQFVDPRGHPAGEPHVMTEPGSHVATQRGYAGGVIVEPGELVPAGIAVAEEWMAPAAAPAAPAAPAAE